MKGRRNERKTVAALEAAKRLRDGQIVGLGSGSTVAAFLPIAAETIKERNMDLFFVPSSTQILLKTKNLNLSLRALEHVDKVDWAIDGADEVDSRLRLVKGGGGALVKERILAHLADHYLIIIDEEKISSSIGESSPIPVEAVPPAHRLLDSWLRLRRLSFTIRVDHRGYPILTENGNVLLDVRLPKGYSPEAFYQDVRVLPGVVDVGLFLDEADEVIVGRTDGTVERMIRER